MAAGNGGVPLPRGGGVAPVSHGWLPETRTSRFVHFFVAILFFGSWGDFFQNVHRKTIEWLLFLCFFPIFVLFFPGDGKKTRVFRLQLSLSIVSP